MTWINADLALPESPGRYLVVIPITKCKYDDENRDNQILDYACIWIAEYRPNHKYGIWSIPNTGDGWGNEFSYEPIITHWHYLPIAPDLPIESPKYNTN